jgi:hypothetical protein
VAYRRIRDKAQKSGLKAAFQSVKKVAERHFFELFSSGACAYGAVSTECKERKPLGFHPF